MANIIEHGQADWDVALNQYLDKTTADSGWTKIPLKNNVHLDAGSFLMVRMIGPFLAIKAQFAVESVGEIAIADIPANLIGSDGWRYMTGYVFSNAAVQCLINGRFELHVISKDATVNQQINLETVIMSKFVDGHLDE